MNPLEALLLENGFSWTTSKILPFVLLTIPGLLVWWFLLRKRLKKHITKLTGGILITFLLPTFYFWYSPLYEGDFTAGGEPIEHPEALKKYEPVTLLVLSLPDCPYCVASTGKMEQLKKRNPDLKITYVVCDYSKESLVKLRSSANASIDVELAGRVPQTIELARGAFPAYILIGKKQCLFWEGDDFSPAALDKVEEMIVE